MRRGVIAVLIILMSASAFALDPEDRVLDANARPTTQELYEDCNRALRFSDSGDYLGFMQSTCGVFMQGAAAGMLLYGLQVPWDKQEALNFKKPILCNQSIIDLEKNPSTRMILTSIGLAEKFAVVYNRYARESQKYDKDSKKYLHFRRFSKVDAATGLGLLSDYIFLSKCK